MDIESIIVMAGVIVLIVAVVLIGKERRAAGRAHMSEHLSHGSGS